MENGLVFRHLYACPRAKSFVARISVINIAARASHSFQRAQSQTPSLDSNKFRRMDYPNGVKRLCP